MYGHRRGTSPRLLEPPERSIWRNLIGNWPLDEASGTARHYLPMAEVIDLVETSSPAAIESVSGPSNNVRLARRFTRADTEELLSAVNQGANLKFRSVPWAQLIWVKLRAITGTDFLFGIEGGGGANRSIQMYASQSANTIRGSVRKEDTSLVDVGTGGITVSTNLDTWIFHYIRWPGPNKTVYLTQNLGAEIIPVGGGVVDFMTTQDAPVIMGNNGAINSGADADISQALIWVGREPSQREMFWLFNNGQGRDLRRGC